MIYNRYILNDVIESLETQPAVLINGARQVGKSTFIEALVSKKVKLSYITLDNDQDLLSLQGDPISFLEQYDSLLAMDEIQRAPDVFISLKRIVDARKKYGQFLLTGSANVLMLPKLSESLAGRMMVYTMWPLSQGEIRNISSNFINKIFQKDSAFKDTKILSDNEWAEILIKGGYPASLKAKTQKQRNTWFKSYLATILQKDIKSLSDIEGLREIPNVLSIVSTRVGNFINVSDVGRVAGIKTTTMQRYFSLLKMVFLVVDVPGWYSNQEKRLIKSPKVFLNDTGLLCHLLGLDTQALINNKTLGGHVFENFVCMELIKQMGWADINTKLYHFRTHTGQEVDFVLEGPEGKIVGVEVKFKRTCHSSDLLGLKKLKELSGNKFHKGVILYQGNKLLFLDKDIMAIPSTVLLH